MTKATANLTLSETPNLHQLTRCHSVRQHTFLTCKKQSFFRLCVTFHLVAANWGTLSTFQQREKLLGSVKASLTTRLPLSDGVTERRDLRPGSLAEAEK